MKNTDKIVAKLEVLEQAYESFSSILKEIPSEIERDAAIQRFEYTFELAWKTLRLVLQNEGFDKIESPKAVLKKGVIVGFINNEIQWFMMLEQRNLTVHTYNKQLATEIYQLFPEFSIAFKTLIEKLKHNKL